MKVRIKDIAERANVSLSTVSLVLNGKPGVSYATRGRILEIARELEEQMPETLFSGRFSKGIIKFLKIAKHGHTVNRDHDGFIADYIEGLAQEAQKNAYSLEIIPFTTTRVQEVVERIRNAYGVGLIVLSTELSYTDLLELQELDCPVIVIDACYDFLKLDCVDMDNAGSVFQAVTNLVENGHRAIGFLRSPIEVQNFRLREFGFIDSLRHYDIPLEEKYIYSVDSTFEGSYHDTLRILEHNDSLPTALFASNDIISYGCMKALKEKGLRIPEDISIIGFDDLPMSAMTDPPLTTVLVNKRRIGASAMRLMISRLETDPDMPPMKVLIGGDLIVRKSVKNLIPAR